MAFDEKLAERVRAVLGEQAEFEERRMFGGIAFMVDGHMCVGIVGDDLMVRVGEEGFPEALARPHARVMDFTGRPSKGMVYVGRAATRTARGLAAWVTRGLAFVRTLPERPGARTAPDGRGRRRRAGKASGAMTTPRRRGR
jgi:TfoX/Sxy family transcriptional regulator of competence genes